MRDQGEKEQCFEPIIYITVILGVTMKELWTKQVTILGVTMKELWTK